MELKVREALRSELGESWKEELPKEMRKFAEVLVKRRESDADALVGISGERGTGKSTLAIWLGALTYEDFSIPRHVAWGLKQVNEKIGQLEEGATWFSDETARALHVREFMKREQRIFIKKIAEIRVKHYIFMSVAPFLTDVDLRLRNQYVFWVHLPLRGHAFVFARYMSPFESDPWLTRLCRDIVRKKYKSVRAPISELLNALRELPTYVTDFKFPDLPKSVRDVYDPIAMAEKLKFLREEEEKEEKVELGEVEKEVLLAVKSGAKTLEDVVGMTGRSREEVSGAVEKLVEAGKLVWWAGGLVATG